MLLLLLLLLWKYYPKEANVECLSTFEAKTKIIFQIDLKSDLKEELDMKASVGLHYLYR